MCIQLLATLSSPRHTRVACSVPTLAGPCFPESGRQPERVDPNPRRNKTRHLFLLGCLQNLPAKTNPRAHAVPSLLQHVLASHTFTRRILGIK